MALKSVLGAFAKLRIATVSFVMSVRPSAWNDSAPTVRILMKNYVCILSEICREYASSIKILL